MDDDWGDESNSSPEKATNFNQVTNLASHQTKPTPAPVTQTKKEPSDDGWGSDGWGESEEEDKDYDNYDLNKLDTNALKKEKAKMDVAFQEKQLKPGDAGFEYDKRVEFEGPKEANDWDDELELEDDDYFDDDFL